MTPKTRILRPLPLLLLMGACALGACSGEPERAPEIVLNPVAPGTRVLFSGVLTLGDRLAGLRDATIEIAVRRESGGPDLLARTYAVDDPARVGDALTFAVSAEDALVDPLPTFSRAMVLVARFDRDGDPRTRGADDVEVVHHVATGATDLFVALGRGMDATRAAQVGSR